MSTVEERVFERPGTTKSHSPLPSNGNGNGTLRTTVTGHGSMLDYLRAMRWWIMGFALLACAASAGFLVLNPVMYRSTVLLIIHDRTAISTTKPDNLLQDVPTSVRVFHLPTSTAMIDHLITEFDLYTHYGIDPNGPLHYELASTRLLGNIDIQLLDDRSANITIRDEDRAMAADMANAVYEKLKAMNEEQVMGSLERRIALYERVINNLEKRSSAQTAQLIALVAELKKPSGRNGGSNVTNEQVDAINFKLSELAAQLTVANEELSQAAEGLEISAALEKESDVPDVHLVRKAVQDIGTSEKRIWVNTLLFTMIGAVILAVVVLAVWFKHGHEVMHDLAVLNGPAHP